MQLFSHAKPLSEVLSLLSASLQVDGVQFLTGKPDGRLKPETERAWTVMRVRHEGRMVDNVGTAVRALQSGRPTRGAARQVRASRVV